jgi:hypothetical protein
MLMGVRVQTRGEIIVAVVMAMLMIVFVGVLVRMCFGLFSRGVRL